MDYLLPDRAPVDSRAIWQELGWDTKTKRKFSTWFRNPTPAEIQGTAYYPHLTGNREQKYGWRPMVKIEFSAPKLFWGNNVNELHDRHFLPVTLTLQARLREMGFNPSLRSLTEAVTTKVHYSKNFVLSNGYTAGGVIRDIRRIDQRKRLTKTAREYPGQGASINLHNKSFGLSIYDKRGELNPETLERLLRNQPSPEILRIEARLENLRKINQVFERLQLGSNPTFSDVFTVDTSRYVLTHFWKELIQPQIALVSDMEETPIDLLERLMQLNPEKGVYYAIKMTSLVLAGRSPGGLSELRSVLSTRLNQRSLYRLHSEIKAVSAQLSITTEQSWWEQIEAQLAEYKPLSLPHINQMI